IRQIVARQEPDAEKDQGARNWADQLKAKVVFFAVAERMENERCDERRQPDDDFDDQALRSEKHTFPLFAVYDAVMLRNIRDHRVRDDENDAQWDAGQQDDEKSGIVRNERSEQAGKSEQQRKEASRQQKERLFRHK